MRYEKIMKQLKSFNFTNAQRKKLASIILKLDKEKQDILVSGDNIATINGQSLLNGGNISLIKTGIFSNKQLIWAVLASAFLMVVILAVPALRHVFSIPVLPTNNIVEIIALVLAPIVIVEIAKLFKLNTEKGE